MRPTSPVASWATLTVPASFHMFPSIVSNTESRVNQSRQISRNTWSQTVLPKHLFPRSCWRLHVSKARERARKEEGLAYSRRSPWLGWATGVPDGCGHQDTSRHARLAGTWVITCLLSPESWTSSWCLQKCSHRPALESWRWAAVCAEGGGAEQPCHGPASRGSCPPPGRLSQAATQMLEGSACPAALSSPGHHCPSLLLLVCR